MVGRMLVSTHNVTCYVTHVVVRSTYTIRCTLYVVVCSTLHNALRVMLHIVLLVISSGCHADL